MESLVSGTSESYQGGINAEEAALPIESVINTYEHAEHAARAKLEKVMTPGFRDFAVRFMNLSEYESLLKGEKLLDGEFIDFKSANPDQDSDFISFSREFSSGRDTELQMNLTDWERQSGRATINTLDAITAIKSIRNEYKGEDRVRRNQEIRSLFLGYIKGSDFYFKSSHNLYSNKSAFLSNNKGIYPDLQDHKDKYDEDKLDVIREFQNDEHYLDAEGNLRKLINVLADLYDSEGEEKRQYHIALIVDSKLTDGNINSWGVGHWRQIFDSDAKQIDESAKASAGILAAISVYPLKEMYEKMIGVVKDSEDSAHPVFDHNGKVRWPQF